MGRYSIQIRNSRNSTEYFEVENGKQSEGSSHSSNQWVEKLVEHEESDVNSVLFKIFSH